MNLYISQVLQLYEMILVRHGLMLVGFPFSGKTKCYHALGAALGLVSEKVSTMFMHKMTNKRTNMPLASIGFILLLCFLKWRNLLMKFELGLSLILSRHS